MENKATIGQVKIIKRLSSILDGIIYKLENFEEINADDKQKLSEIQKFLLDLILLEDTIADS